MNTNISDYQMISDLLVDQLASDGHSLDNVHQAVFHIQAHSSDNNTLRLTYPGIPLFPTRALAIVGYNTYGIMTYCMNDFNVRLSILGKDRKMYSKNINIKSIGDYSVPLKLPSSQIITHEIGVKIGLGDDEIDRLNRGESIRMPIGKDAGQISIEYALLYATNIYYKWIEKLQVELGDKMPDPSAIRRKLLELHKKMYDMCGLRDFPNCIERGVPGLYKDIYYVYEKTYSLFESPGENTICEFKTEQGTDIEVRMPRQLSPYGLYIMHSTLDYLSRLSIKIPSVPTVADTVRDTIKMTIQSIYDNIFTSNLVTSTLPPEDVEDVEYRCITQSNIMYKMSDIAGTYTGKAPELFHNIIKLRLESDLFRALIPIKKIRDQIANYWYIITNLDLHKNVAFSQFQFYLSYILLLDVSIIDGSCRRSTTKTSLISPSLSLKSDDTMSVGKTLLQNKTADIISIVTTDRINKSISDFKRSSANEKFPSIVKWIDIFYKKNFTEMLASLRSPWFNYEPPSMKKSGWDTIVTGAMKLGETRESMSNLEKQEEIIDRQQEYINYIIDGINARLEAFFSFHELEYPITEKIKNETKKVILKMNFLDPSDIRDEVIDAIIKDIIVSQIIRQTSSRKLSRQLGKIRTRDTEEVLEEVPQEVPEEIIPSKIRRISSGVTRDGSKGGYKPKRKTVRRKKGTRRQKITKNKRKITRKQY
jgi:hypothetical protein